MSAVGEEGPPAPAAQDESQLVREDSHVLGEEGGSEVTFAEFPRLRV